MSYSTGAELKSARNKCQVPYSAFSFLRNEVRTHMVAIDSLQKAVIQMGKDMKAMTKLIKEIRQQQESITGELK